MLLEVSGGEAGAIFCASITTELGVSLIGTGGNTGVIGTGEVTCEGGNPTVKP
ncbi:hypothetical protein NDK43_06990 [Neobacillus pocheonensis]|uniref:Uncharacterized protein n=1 Tax=Neobacillus pocheonensis TaxID=363869 RepID=A0ABT0WB11_9BACI|nr:hypothetical protein [Neobacillus pocheonensis]